MASRIPEIRIYSPSDKGEDSMDDGTSLMTLTGGVSNHCSFGGINGNILDVGQDWRSSLFLRKQLQREPLTAPFDANADIKYGTVRWEGTFTARPMILSNFPATTCRTTYRSHAVAMHRARLGCVTSSAKSLDILRQNLQRSINKEIHDILQKYLEKYFKQGIENIKLNSGENSVSDQHVQAVCRQILEEAKKMYHGSTGNTRGNSPGAEYSDSETNSPVDAKSNRAVLKSGHHRRRKESDTDSEISLGVPKQKRKKGRPPIHYQSFMSGGPTTLKLKSLDHIKREGQKWNPERLTPETLFIMGAKANKALGLGATRGRLYIKHPEIFKYSGDQEDKQWLYDHNLMPATGGKAYLLLVEDIREVAQSEEYCSNPSLRMDEIVGFTVPESMLHKMRATMQAQRANASSRKRGRPPVVLDNTDRNSMLSDQKLGELGMDDKRLEGESGTVSPTDELDLLVNDMPSGDPSPFSLGPGFEDVSPAAAEASPAASDSSGTLEPPLSAPFDIRTPQ